MQCCPYFTDWVSDLYGIEETVLHVYGSGILPCSQYDVQVVSKTCLDLTDERCYSDILTIHTAKWGDVWPPFGGSGQPNFTDIGKVVDKFKDISPPLKVQAMLRGNVPPLDTPVNFTDIGRVVEAFKGLPYNEVGPPACSPCP